MSYTKYTRTILSGQDLLDFIATTAVLHGWTNEFVGDNIIDSVNLGKKLILKKDGKLVYLAAADNNNPTGSNTSFVTNNICCLKYCISKTAINTSNRWWDNSIKQDGTANFIDGLQYGIGKTFVIYANDDHMVFICFQNVGLYTSGLIGNVKPISHSNVFAAFGCLLTNTDITTGRLTTRPFLDLKSGLKSVLVNNTDVYTTSNGLVVNNFIWRSGLASGVSYDHYATSNIDGRSAAMNKAVNDEFIIVVDVNGHYEKTGTFGAYERLFYLDELYIVNFVNLEPNQNKSNGAVYYDVFPFYKKEIPQNYGNLETFGLGFAFLVNEPE